MNTHPTCVGEYETDDPECNGDGADDPHPCTWRDQCGGFKAHLAQSGQQRSIWVGDSGELVTLEPFEFKGECDKWVELYEVVDGLSAAEKTEIEKLPLDDLFDVFLAYLVAEVDREYAPPGVFVLPGQLYLQDHRTQHQYVTVYCRARRGCDKPLARVATRRKAKALQIRLPVTARMAAKLGLDASVLRSAGQFRSQVVLDEKNALPLARKLAALVAEGRIKLPAKAPK